MGVNGLHAMTDYAASNFEATGVVRQNYCIRISQITDGTSSTLMVARQVAAARWADRSQAGR